MRSAFEVPFPPGADGSYSLPVLAQTGAEPLASQPFAVRVDRQVPRLMIDAGTRHVATQSLIVRGFANEPCRIFVLGREEMAVQSEADGAFALPLSVPKDEGTTTLVLQARDLAGNENLEAATFAVEVDLYTAARRGVGADVRANGGPGGADSRSAQRAG